MIKLGYEIKTGKEVFVSPSHLIVTGITQLSGKTTTLEALIKRSGLKAIVFKTKIGEKSFTEGTEVAPFFRDRSDYEFVKSLIEAYSKEKLFLEKGTLMRLCKGSSNLIDIKKKVDEALTGKMNAINLEIHTRLQHYLENLIPQIQYANLSKTLQVYEGINIMNLERFSEEAQALIIQSVADEVLKTMNNVIIVIPEAWKFLPQKYNNPCKRVVESFIRQGATNGNYVWIDSQDMAGVDKIPLKQISTWILGYQSERNEVKHTLDEISLPKKSKPTEEEIMNLKKGHFFLSSYEGVKSVYVQPLWVDDEDAEKIAKGLLDVSDFKAPNSLTPFNRPTIKEKDDGVEIRFDDSSLRKQINELRIDTFNKFQEVQNIIQKVYEEIYTIKQQKPEINTSEIVGLVLQKIPINKSNGNLVIDEEELIRKIIARVPASGNKVYNVLPLEKIKKDFLEETKNKIIEEISKLSNDTKRMLKYLETKNIGIKANELIFKCYCYNSTGGSQQRKVSDCSKELLSIFLIRKDTAGNYYTELKNKIKSYLGNFEATEQEIEQVHNHILMEILK
jgi:hypothetical protein